MHERDLPSNRRRHLWVWGVRALAGLLALGVSAATLEAQPLAEVARREAARRKALRTEARVYTNRDLGPGAIRPAVLGQPAAVAAEAAETPPAAAEPQGEVKDEKFWRDRVTQVREAMARAEILRSALEARINALQTDFVNRDDPAQKAVIAQDRQKAIDELARNNADIERFKKEITDIQDEARKAGVPPGWVR